ncbi:hypothetical protein [Paludibacterium yongneupense]|uniref:hypothetical protein n=1 Tax=Paludibacterium yongneupense TaxID=400061 RepID=UPI000429F3D2|nr:hypothetical protein [Paludibacterium yongneupense]
MSEAIPVKVQRFAEQIPGGVSELSPAEQKDMAVDILAKIGRLPELEYSAIAAIMTRDPRAINAAAKALPHTWPTGLRREMARGWATEKGLVRSQKDIGETYMRSQQSVSNYWQETIRTLDRHYWNGLSVVEVQVLDLLDFHSRRNAHRAKVSA